jgi:hypothetical protein
MLHDIIQDPSVTFLEFMDLSLANILLHGLEIPHARRTKMDGLSCDTQEQLLCIPGLLNSSVSIYIQLSSPPGSEKQAGITVGSNLTF